jgi:hypothetical protein
MMQRQKHPSSCTLFTPLRQEQVDRLDAFGFVWEITDRFGKQWSQKIEQLERYKQEHGDCLVPKRYKDQSLRKWVNSQRTRRPTDPSRVERLNLIGFVWAPNEQLEEQWNTMFEQLERYKLEHCDCLVPARYKDDRALGHWVITQRRRRLIMNPNRVERLNSIGFCWKAPRGGAAQKRNFGVAHSDEGDSESEYEL